MTRVTRETGVLTRRNALLGVAAAATAVAFARCGGDATGQAAQRAVDPPGPPPALAWPDLLPPPPPAARVPLPGGAVLSTLPGSGNLLALTLDDGVDSNVVRAYGQLARDTGIRLTMFANGVYSSWTDHRDLLRPLVDSGQLQLGNHTWRHRDLTKLSAFDVADELRHNDQFLRNTFGVDATPYFRPPYGAFNDLVTKVAADLGYTVVTMWNGNVGDDVLLTPRDVVANASKYFAAQNVVIGHLNHPPVTGVYHQLLDVIAERNLRTVTLDDVFTRPEVSRLTSTYPT